MKRILIIGGSSFIAGQFIRNYQSVDSITCYSRRPTGYDKEIVVKAFWDMPVESFVGFDAVINFAAIVHRPEEKNQELYDEVNYRIGSESPSGRRSSIYSNEYDCRVWYCQSYFYSNTGNAEDLLWKF